METAVVPESDLTAVVELLTSVDNKLAYLQMLLEQLFIWFAVAVVLVAVVFIIYIIARPFFEFFR